MRFGWSFIYYLPMNVQLLQKCLLKRYTSSIEMLSHLCQKSVGNILQIFFLIFYSLPLIHVSILSLVSNSFHYYSFVIKLEICYTVSFHIVLLLKLILAILVPLIFNMNFRIILFIPRKTLAWILIRIALNLHINLVKIDILI